VGRKKKILVRQCVRKGQVHGVEKGNITGQIAFIASLFGLVA
jgi:hypothetical protein